MSLLNSRNGKLLLVRYLSNYGGINRLIVNPFVFFKITQACIPSIHFTVISHVGL